MELEELRAIVRDAIREVMAELAQPRRGLVLFTGALLGFDEAAAALARLKAAGWELNMVQTESARHVLDPARIAELGLVELHENLVRDHELLLVPTLTVNLAAKASLGIADCLGSNLVHQFLLQNRPVVAVRAAACPDSPEKRAWFPDINPALARRMRVNLTELHEMGVELCAPHELDAVAERARRRAPARLPADGNPPAAGHLPEPHTCSQRVVTQATLTAVPEGVTLRLVPRAIVTDLAQDLARQRRITLERVTEGV